MNTLEEFKYHMDWTMLELSDEEVEGIYNEVDDSSYKHMEDLEDDFPLEDNLHYTDVNLHSVVEAFQLVLDVKRPFISFYYLEHDGMYAGVLEYIL